MKSFLIAVLFAACGALLAAGCASSESGGGTAVAERCPVCKTEVKRGKDTHGRDTYSKHTCPGCKGAVETFFAEGKWAHKCGICPADAKCSYCGKH